MTHSATIVRMSAGDRVLAVVTRPSSVPFGIDAFVRLQSADGVPSCSMDEAILDVLKEIREEARQTNARLDQTNAPLDQTNARLGSVEEEIKGLGRRITDSEMRLTTEVLSLAGVTRDVRDLLTRADLGALQHRVRTLEEIVGKRE